MIESARRAASHAVVLYTGGPGESEIRLGKVLSFFGIPWTLVDASAVAHHAEADAAPTGTALLASMPTLAALVRLRPGAALLRRSGLVYTYPAGNRAESEHALRSIPGLDCWGLGTLSAGAFDSTHPGAGRTSCLHTQGARP